GTSTSDSFTYCANGRVTGTPAICSSGITATVTLSGATLEAASGIHVNDDQYTSNIATFLGIKSPGVLGNDTDGAGYPLTVATSTVTAVTVTGSSPIGQCAS